MRIVCFLFLFLFVFISAINAQSIRGGVQRLDTKVPLGNVEIFNSRTGAMVTTDDTGLFELAFEVGDVFEFRKEGFKTEWLRMESTVTANYYKILMKLILPNFYVNHNKLTGDYSKDSAILVRLYAPQLGKAKLSGFEKIQHPFSAMSKHNRQIWAFQDNFVAFEKWKYIQYTFSDELIQKTTGLKGDSLYYFKKRFTPSYEQLRTMGIYELLKYIQESAAWYRTGINPKHRRGRNAG